MHLSSLVITQLAILGVANGTTIERRRLSRSGSNLRADRLIDNTETTDAFAASLLGRNVNTRKTYDEVAAEMEAWERLLGSASASFSQPAPAPTTKAPTPTPPAPTPPTPIPPTTTPPTTSPPTTPAPTTPTPITPTTAFPTAAPSDPPSPVPTDCCSLPPGSRRQQLFDIYSQVSDPQAIATPGTPQNLAFEWLINDDQFCVCPNTAGCELIQRYVMAVYYYSTDGPAWLNCGADSAVCSADGTLNPTEGLPSSGCFEGADARWLTNVTSCEWCGNLCEAEDDSCITRIALANLDQGGTVPFELQNITNLFFLSNQMGTIGGSLPTQLGNLANLSFIDFDFNMLTGTIPEQLYFLPNMSSIDLNDNKLTGSISNNIGNLDKLFYLQLGNQANGTNSFTGTIPAGLGQLPLLNVLDLQNLNLVGTLPSFTNTDPVFFDVSGNGLTGNLDATDWGSLSNLRNVTLSDNQFTGTIPSSFGAITVLSLADFIENNLTGTMPEEICSLRPDPLEFLQSDCGGSPPKVACSCCTFCFPPP